MNDPDAARVMLDTQSLPEQPHEVPSLAASGWKQHYFTWSKTRTTAGKKGTAGTEGTATLTSEQYESVTEHLKKSQAAVSKKRPSPKQKEPESEEKKRKREDGLFRAQCLRKCKSELEKTNALIATNVALLPKLSEKGYPTAVRDFCQAKIDSLEKAKDQCQTIYNTEVVLLDADNPRAGACRIENATAELERQAKDWKKGSGAEIAKLAA